MRHPVAAAAAHTAQQAQPPSILQLPLLRWQPGCLQTHHLLRPAPPSTQPAPTQWQHCSSSCCRMLMPPASGRRAYLSGGCCTAEQRICLVWLQVRALPHKLLAGNSRDAPANLDVAADLLICRDQLVHDRVSRRTVVAAPGETVVVEHAFTNPLSRGSVFELRVSHPQQLAPISDAPTYHALTAVARTLPAGAVPDAAAVAAPAGALRPALAQLAAAGRTVFGQQLLPGGRLYLEAGEAVTLPFSLRALPAQLQQTGSAAARPGAAMPLAGGSSSSTAGEVMSVEFVASEQQAALAVLEAQVGGGVSWRERGHASRCCILHSASYATLKPASISYNHAGGIASRHHASYAALCGARGGAVQHHCASGRRACSSCAAGQPAARSG